MYLFEFTTVAQCAQMSYCNGLRPLILSCRSQLTAEVHCWLWAAVLITVWKTLGRSAQLLGRPHHLFFSFWICSRMFQDPAMNLRPKGGGERKLRFIWAWKHDGILLMGFGYAEYRLLRDLAGFEPVTICFQHCPGRGVRVKNHCVGLRPAPPLAEASVTAASYR